LDLSTFLKAGLALVIGLVAGAALYAFWLRQIANAKLRLPDKWPLAARGVVTSDELEVLKWLRATFHDHMVMVKLPVLRYTTPTSKEENGGGDRWQDLLGGVYCTFTVCSPNGKVVGCVDVPGRRDISRAARQLKESLLSDCNIAYTLVRHNGLPKGSAMRAAFLGEIEVEDQVEHLETRGGDSSFHADLDAFTRQKKQAAKDAALKELNKNNDVKAPAKAQPAGFNPDGTGGFTARKSDRRYPTQFEDSFTHSDESRPAKLG
jgi:hypothetical protein